MPVLLDTNILARLANTADALYPVASRAVVKLHRRGEVLHTTAQNLVGDDILVSHGIKGLQAVPGVSTYR